MKRLTENKIILITRATRLEELVARFNTLGQAKFYVEHLGADFTDYEIEHGNYKNALQATETQLRALGRVQVLDRAFLTNFVFGEQDAVVVLGQDGLVANTAKYVGGGAAVGAVLGALLGGGKGAAIGALAGGGAGAGAQVLTGKKKGIPAETQLSYKLAQPLTLRPVAAHRKSGMQTRSAQQQ